MGSPELVRQPGGGAATLSDLGCAVRVFDLWDGLDAAALAADPPAAALIEARDEVEAGRAALSRLRAVAPLREVPMIVATTVNALPRLRPSDGFDDFTLYPYVPAELYFRIRTAQWQRSEFNAPERIKIGRMVVDLAAHEVRVDGALVALTQQEFALLRFLCGHRGRVFSRDQLLQQVWGVAHYGSSRTVDIHVRRLRMKLGSAVQDLETVRGVGYKMREP